MPFYWLYKILTQKGAHMKQRTKKNQKVFRTLIQLAQKSDSPEENNIHSLQQGKKTKDKLDSPYSFSAGKFKYTR
jgi:hypothetical protein